MSPGFCKSVANIKIPKHKSCMDSQFTEFQKCFTTKITSLNSYISVKFTLTLKRLSTEIKTHRLLLMFFNFLGFVTILSSRESLRTICCTELKLPPMLVLNEIELGYSTIAMAIIRHNYPCSHV